jgi:hypothetical protein
LKGAKDRDEAVSNGIREAQGQKRRDSDKQAVSVDWREVVKRRKLKIKDAAGCKRNRKDAG